MSCPLCYQARSVGFSFPLMYFSVLNFHLVLLYIFYFFAETFYLPTHSWNMVIISDFKSLFEIILTSVILALVSLFCLFPSECRFHRFFLSWVIQDCILDILNIILWESGSYLSPTKSAGVFILASNWPSWVHTSSSDHPSVACISNFSLVCKAFEVILNVFHNCPTQCPVWGLGVVYPIIWSSMCRSGSYTSTHSLEVSSGVCEQF